MLRSFAFLLANLVALELVQMFLYIPREPVNAVISSTPYYSLSSQPATMGSVTIKSYPEDGMLIHLNGKYMGITTPAKLDSVPPGTHTITLMSEWYRSQETDVTIQQGQTDSIIFTMIPLYANLTVNTTKGGTIYVDEIKRGATSWTGRVLEGDRLVRVEMQNYHPRQWEVGVVRGRDIGLDLMMRPKTGAVEVVTEPNHAAVELNGVNKGRTPLTITGIPLGKYTLSIYKEGYTGVLKSMDILDNEIVTISIHLVSGKGITVLSNPEGADLFLADSLVGSTPLTFDAKFGKHEIILIKGDLIIVDEIDVSHHGANEFSFALNGFEDMFFDNMVLVGGGTFQMGDTFGDGNKEERPTHQVTLNDFYISKYEVTNAQWEHIMRGSPSDFSHCPDCPVERVSWHDVQRFIRRLNRLSGLSYRLPTEAEWEFAAKGGIYGNGYRYAGGDNINLVSWYSGNSNSRTNPVGVMQPNELGLYDMSGNVWEWSADWFAPYSDEPKVSPAGPTEGLLKVVKGGGWFGYPGGSRVSCRGSDDPTSRRSYIGFRLALSEGN